jgi:hypothetical protein
MLTFYKIDENGLPDMGMGDEAPDDCIVYTVGEEPEELVVALAKKKVIDDAKQAEITSSETRKQQMLEGDIYTLDGTDYRVSFTKDDGDGMIQVKISFELGMQSTNIRFDNGTVMPMTADKFLEFSTWFVDKRNKFF